VSVYGLNREPTDPVLWRHPLVSGSRIQGPEGDHSHTDGQTPFDRVQYSCFMLLVYAVWNGCCREEERGKVVVLKPKECIFHNKDRAQLYSVRNTPELHRERSYSHQDTVE
jgi:hypothetical protein